MCTPLTNGRGERAVVPQGLRHAAGGVVIRPVHVPTVKLASSDLVAAESGVDVCGADTDARLAA